MSTDMNSIEHFEEMSAEESIAYRLTKSADSPAYTSFIAKLIEAGWVDKDGDTALKRFDIYCGSSMCPIGVIWSATLR